MGTETEEKAGLLGDAWYLAKRTYARTTNPALSTLVGAGALTEEQERKIIEADEKDRSGLVEDFIQKNTNSAIEKARASSTPVDFTAPITLLEAVKKAAVIENKPTQKIEEGIKGLKDYIKIIELLNKNGINTATIPAPLEINRDKIKREIKAITNNAIRNNPLQAVQLLTALKDTADVSEKTEIESGIAQISKYNATIAILIKYSINTSTIKAPLSDTTENIEASINALVRAHVDIDPAAALNLIKELQNQTNDPKIASEIADLEYYNFLKETLKPIGTLSKPSTDPVTLAKEVKSALYSADAVTGRQVMSALITNPRFTSNLESDNDQKAPLWMKQILLDKQFPFARKEMIEQINQGLSSQPIISKLDKNTLGQIANTIAQKLDFQIAEAEKYAAISQQVAAKYKDTAMGDFARIMLEITSKSKAFSNPESFIQMQVHNIKRMADAASGLKNPVYENELRIAQEAMQEFNRLRKSNNVELSDAKRREALVTKSIDVTLKKIIGHLDEKILARALSKKDASYQLTPTSTVMDATLHGIMFSKKTDAAYFIKALALSKMTTDIAKSTDSEVRKMLSDNIKKTIFELRDDEKRENSTENSKQPKAQIDKMIANGFLIGLLKENPALKDASFFKRFQELAKSDTDKLFKTNLTKEIASFIEEKVAANYNGKPPQNVREAITIILDSKYPKLNEYNQAVGQSTNDFIDNPETSPTRVLNAPSTKRKIQQGIAEERKRNPIKVFFGDLFGQTQKVAREQAHKEVEKQVPQKDYREEIKTQFVKQFKEEATKGGFTGKQLENVHMYADKLGKLTYKNFINADISPAKIAAVALDIDLNSSEKKPKPTYESDPKIASVKPELQKTGQRNKYMGKDTKVAANGNDNTKDEPAKKDTKPTTKPA